MTEGASQATTEERAVGDVRAIPRHVAIIMDGNGRWARQRRMSRSDGHRAGTSNIRRVLRRFADHDVEHVTLFAFSTENWDRPDEEVGTLMELLGESIRSETQPLYEEGVRIKHIGRLDDLPPRLQDAIHQSVELTKANERMTLNVAFNYGGRAEIVNAVRSIVSEGLEPGEITEELFERYLYTSGLPDVDLIIRTAGEMRLSNFLLWQAHYAEYYSTAVLWPDFDEQEVTSALEAYSQRKRRYGKVTAADDSLR